MHMQNSFTLCPEISVKILKAVKIGKLLKCYMIYISLFSKRISARRTKLEYLRNAMRRGKQEISRLTLHAYLHTPSAIIIVSVCGRYSVLYKRAYNCGVVYYLTAVFTVDYVLCASGKIFLASDGTITTGTNSGGGGSEWKHIAHTTLTVNTTSTSAASAGTLSCGTEIVDKNKIIYVRIRDTQGARAGYHAGSDAYFMNYNKANGSTSAFAVPAVLCYRYTTSSAWAGTAGQYGVYGYSISNTGVLTVRRRYNSNYSLTINSTFDVDVFTLDYPSGYPSVFNL